MKMPGASCSVTGCTKSATKAKNSGTILHFHRLPKDPIKRLKWMKKCHISEFINLEYARVCSEHFSINDYDDLIKARVNKTVPKVLKSEAIPSLNLPGNIQKQSNSEIVSRVKLWKEKYVNLLKEYKDLKYQFTMQEAYVDKLKQENVELKLFKKNVKVVPLSLIRNSDLKDLCS